MPKTVDTIEAIRICVTVSSVDPRQDCLVANKQLSNAERFQVPAVSSCAIDSNNPFSQPKA